MVEKTTASLADVKNYFKFQTITQFKKEWKELSEADQLEIRDFIFQGIK